ncbi:hypothetical protein ACIHFE_32465 [Streptomyces sp. NPDC052396]|uniref:hypothetical protein n=1 Tax=Streptomyces sp. NPDC052396 TaxID=3365689 RepID=UPI0037D65AF9
MRGSQDSSATQAVRTILASSRTGEGEEARGAGSAALRALEEARPARTVAARIATAGGADGEVARRLQELVEQRLGDHAGRWLGVHDALAGYRGTLPALLADAPQPAAPAASGEVRSPVPRSVHDTFALLLEHARPRQAARALTVLPDRTVQGLLAGGALPGPALVTAVTEHGDSRTRTALARHPRLDTRVLARLLEVGDARVGAAVYRNPRATQSLRRTLAHRLDSAPMDQALRAELTDPGGDLPRTWLAPLLGSGDPTLVARALSLGVRGVAQQYALVRVWERGGAEALRGLLGDPAVTRHLSPRVRTEVTDALAEDGGSGDALRRLRERCEPYADPARLPSLLAVTRGTSSLRDLLSEPYVHDLRALCEAHVKSPFMPVASEELARHEEASDAQRLAFRLSVLNEPWRPDGRRAGNVTQPERRLAEEELDEYAGWWAEGMVRAGLLDPVELIRTARPSGPALSALALLAERGLLTATAVAELRSLTDTHLGERPESWAALERLLPAHRGNLRELISQAGQAAQASQAGPAGAEPAGDQEGAARTGAEQQERAEPPQAPRNSLERAALAALDLLRSLAPADAPLPTDHGVLAFLARHSWDKAPGLTTPPWLVQACADQGVEPADARPWHTAPTLAEVWAKPPQSCGSSATLTELAYTQGILPADELLAFLPARRMLLPHYDWRRLAFAGAWRAALARRLRAELGADPDAWLQLAETAWAAAGDPGADRGTGGPSWLELLSLARSMTRAGEAAANGYRPLEESASSSFTRRPGTPDQALGLLERGNHLWAWPVGTLLCLADADTVDAILPRLGPDGPWLLAAYLLRHDHTPRLVFDRLLAGRDPHALRILALQSRWLEDGLVERLAELDDPEVDLALLRQGGNPHLARRIVARTRRSGSAAGPVAAQVLAELRAEPSARPIGGLHWLCSAEPDLIEEIFARKGTELGLVHQILGCLHLLEHGGAHRLTALIGRDLLGQAATKLCVKALAAKDPAAVIRARLDRELAPDKLVKKVRRAQAPWQVRSAVEAVPVGADWQALEAAHQEEPLPHWEQLVKLPDAPAELLLRHAALVREPGPNGLAQGACLTRARARHGLAGLYHCAPVTQLDGLLDSGILTGSDLLHLAAPAALMLAYLGSAARRTDAPAEAGAALTELAGLVRARLGTDAAAWTRVTNRLTGRDPQWEPMSPVALLLS